MKKIFTILSAVAIFGILNAQNNSENYRFFLGDDLGITTTINYSPLSAFEDTHESYSIPTNSFFFGFKNSRNDSYQGVSIVMMSANTAQPFKEKFENTMVLWSTQRSMPLFNNLNIMYRCGVGAAWMRNRCTIDGDDLKINRYGLAAKCEGGLIYNISSLSYIGITGGLTTVSKIHDKYDVPETAQKNDKHVFFGKQLSVTYGIRF